MISLIGKLPVKASNGTRKLSEIVYAVVHHEAVKSDGRSTVEHLISDANYHISKDWNRIAYHFCVGKDGTVYELNPLTEIAYHAGNLAYIRDSFGIVLEGDLSVERPSGAQIGALWGLLDDLCTKRPDLPKVVKATVKTHKEVRTNPTSCPSYIIQKVVDAYRL